MRSDILRYFDSLLAERDLEIQLLNLYSENLENLSHRNCVDMPVVLELLILDFGRNIPVLVFINGLGIFTWLNSKPTFIKRKKNVNKQKINIQTPF